MGKKKKYKKDLFDTDYADISLEEQLKMSMLAQELLEGKTDNLGFKNKPKEDVKEDVLDNKEDKESLDAFFSTISSSLGYGHNENDDFEPSVSIGLDGYENTVTIEEAVSHEELASFIKEDCVVIKNTTNESKESTISYEELNEGDNVSAQCNDKNTSFDDNNESYDNEDKIVTEELPKLKPITKNNHPSINEIKSNIFDVNDDGDDKEEYDDEEEEMESTLDSTFKVIQGDHSLGDIVVKDAWEDFKSHTFTFYNMIPANMNYDKSPLYTQMCGFIDLTIAFIAGPLLVIKQGNEKFKEFIKTVAEIDRERIFVFSKTSETEFDADGNPAIHFLIYYIDRESKEELEILFETFEHPDDDNNKIILDFLYSVYKKAIDRHENPWACYESLDALIDEKESDDDDLDFVLDLIKEDEDTVLGESDIDLFLDNYVLPIETFIKEDDSPAVLYTFVKLLDYVFDMSRDDIVIENGIIQVPDNFGYTNYGSNDLNYHVAANDINKLNEADKQVKTEVTVNTTTETKVEIKESISEVVTKDQEEPEEIEDTDFDLDDIEIDDIDDGDDILEDVLQVEESKPDPEVKTVEPVKKLSVSNSNSNGGIKKFGSTPYKGGSMVIKS